MLLIIHHTGEHRSGSPSRCQCSERTRTLPGSWDLNPADQYAFVNPAARARYERWEVDPRCQREHAEDVEVKTVVRRVVAEIWP